MNFALSHKTEKISTTTGHRLHTIDHSLSLRIFLFMRQLEIDLLEFTFKGSFLFSLFFFLGSLHFFPTFSQKKIILFLAHTVYKHTNGIKRIFQPVHTQQNILHQNSQDYSNTSPLKTILYSVENIFLIFFPINQYNPLIFTHKISLVIINRFLILTDLELKKIYIAIPDKKILPVIMNYSNSINHQGQTSINPHSQEAFSIPVKICDGLFMADRHIAQDIEFFQTNLISHVINCAGQEVQNCRKVADVAFLTFDWSENSIQNITEQKVVSVTVNFIEECRRNSGCLLIHYSESESRPFCLLACYFMIKFKWSLFKTLQFLNSRKEDVELEPAFFEQLTSFSQKLQEKGLIRSKIWSILPGMSDEQIILTNTYCNSKNKFSSNQNLTGNTKKRPSSASSLNKYNNPQKSQPKNVQWKKELVVQHVYSPHVAVNTLNENTGGKNLRSNSDLVATNTSKEKNINANSSSKSNGEIVRAQRILSTNNTATPQNSHKTSNNSSHKQSSSVPKQESSQTPIPASNLNSINNSNNNSAQMNVTKKWAQLRQMWLKEKQNYHQQQNTSNSSNGGGSNNNNTSLICKKQGQRINDRLQDKLNMLKKHEQKVIQSSNNNNMGKNNRSNNELNKKKQMPVQSSGKQKKKQRSLHKDKQEQQQQQQQSNNSNNENINNGNKNISSNNTGTNPNNRVVHNNWIIDNHHLINTNNKNDISSSSNNNNNCNNNNAACNTRNSIKGTASSHNNKNSGTPCNSSSNNHSKSVIIVKPNHNIEGSNGNQQTGSRSSLRKMNNSQRKEDKENYYKENNSHIGSANGGSMAKFFRNEVADIISTNANNKGRSNSVKPQRKDSMMSGTQNITAMALSKNGSLKGKGKWKF